MFCPTVPHGYSYGAPVLLMYYTDGIDIAITVVMALQHYTDSALVYLLEALYASPRAYSVTPSAVLAEIRRRATSNARATTEERWS